MCAICLVEMVIYVVEYFSIHYLTACHATPDVDMHPLISPSQITKHTNHRTVHIVLPLICDLVIIVRDKLSQFPSSSCLYNVYSIFQN